jgi:deazaflavin-dependent oxidoreductase (nitroreductase family)
MAIDDNGGAHDLDKDYLPSPRGWVRDQVSEYESSGGTAGTTLRNRGLPVVVLTMIGAKTGAIRKVPLMRVEHDGRYLAVASMGGAPKNPVWYHNLTANPVIDLQDGPARFRVRARELPAGEERDAWWARAVAAYPDYADYQTRTSRLIPVFVLEPVGDPR